jgi:uncharacterized protein
VDLFARHETEPLAEWPHAFLDIEAMRHGGWRPLPFRQFVLKLHSRCNLSCAYCYVFNGPDQGWRRRPPRMPEEVLDRTAERIAEHVHAHGLQDVQVVFHGGEPLLAGAGFLDLAATRVRDAVGPGVGVDLRVQTNGTLLDPGILAVLRRHRVRVSVSLDGEPASHDAHRGRSGGRGSHAAVVRGLALLRAPENRDLFAGLLCVVDPGSDPVAAYEHLLAHEPPAVDFLLPHANWSNPPARPPGHSSHPSPGRSATPYGDWLVAVFDRWYSAPRAETSVRYFVEIIRGVLGRPSRVESIGLSPACLVVVETDGSIEQHDALKSVYDGAAATGMHVDQHPFDAVTTLPQVVARQIGVEALDDTCRACDLRDICGGGFYPHRYLRGSGFRNPSVYCDDIARLIRHVRARVHRDLGPAVHRTQG